MRDLGDDLERRQSPRHRQGAVCELFLAGRHHAAEVVDMSRGGVFVTSDAPLWPGALVRIRARDVERYALVMRERQLPMRLRGLVPRGFGLRWIARGTSA